MGCTGGHRVTFSEIAPWVVFAAASIDQVTAFRAIVLTRAQGATREAWARRRVVTRVGQVFWAAALAIVVLFGGSPAPLVVWCFACAALWLLADLLTFPHGEDGHDCTDHGGPSPNADDPAPSALADDEDAETPAP